jgi:replication factor C subunit 2/4
MAATRRDDERLCPPAKSGRNQGEIADQPRPFGGCGLAFAPVASPNASPVTRSSSVLGLAATTSSPPLHRPWPISSTSRPGRLRLRRAAPPPKARPNRPPTDSSPGWRNSQSPTFDNFAQHCRKSITDVSGSRPKTLSDVTSQSHTTDVLTRTLANANLPHMLFYGPPGTGKTSTILALAKQLYGPELFRSRVLELNASDERGISIVREKVKDFARQQLSNPPAGPAGVEYRKKYPCPPFKIIILDEADSMTQDAQSALRRTMETYSKITRFCLVCNYVTRIIDPLASRCSKFRFKMLESGSASRRIEEIAAAEGVKMEDGVVEALVRCAEGDLRKAITFLQSAARLVGAVAPVKSGQPANEDEMDVDDDASKTGGNPVTVRSVEEIAGVVPGSTIERLVAAMQPGQASYFQTVRTVVRELVAEGWSAAQVVAQLFEVVLRDETVSNRQKNTIALAFSETDQRLVNGADEHLTVLELASTIAQTLRE